MNKYFEKGFEKQASLKRLGVYGRKLLRKLDMASNLGHTHLYHGTSKERAVGATAVAGTGVAAANHYSNKKENKKR